MVAAQRSTWRSRVNTWHVFWRIARPSRASPFRRLTHPVSVSESLVPLPSGSLRVRLYRPPVHSATIVLNGGFVRESIDDPRLVNFATALAETGFLVLTPDYPAVRALEFTPATIDQIVGLVGYLRQSSDWCGQRPLALIGLSYVGTLSLKAALRPDLTAPPEFLGVFGGYADFGELMRAVFEDAYRSNGIAVPVDPYGRFLVLRAVVDHFDPPSVERDRIREVALSIGRRRPRAEIDADIADLSPAGRACVAALRAFHPDRAPEQWGRILREFRDTIEDLSVREPAERLRSRLVILHSVYDHILPCTGSILLHQQFPESRLVLTTIFTHVNPRLSPALLWSHARELGALSGMFGELMALQG